MVAVTAPPGGFRAWFPAQMGHQIYWEAMPPPGGMLRWYTASRALASPDAIVALHIAWLEAMRNLLTGTFQTPDASKSRN